jgi:hypothetical protein
MDTALSLSNEQSGLDRFVALVGNLAVFVLKKIPFMDVIAENVKDDLKKRGMLFLNQEEEQQLAPRNRIAAMQYEGNDDTQPELANPLESTAPLQQEPNQGWEAEHDNNGGVTLINHGFKNDLMAGKGPGMERTSAEADAMMETMRKIKEAQETGYSS